MDDGGRIQRDLCAMSLPAGAEHRQPQFCVRLAFSRHRWRGRGVCRPGRAAGRDHDHPRRTLSALRRNRDLAPHPGRCVLRGGRASDRGRVQDDDAADQAARLDRIRRARRRVCRDRDSAAAVARRPAGGDPDQHRHPLRDAPEQRRMNPDANPLLTLAWTFALTSLFAVGGANSAIPEMHRVAVDVQHWMTEKQFADAFAISQLSPGPNVLIVTLIGYSVAGVAGALVATIAMCVPTAVLAYGVSRLLTRSSHARW